MNTENIIVVGSGISGMYTAHLLKSKNPESNVLILESANQVGGLLKSFRYPNGAVFDQGIHTYYETGIHEIDKFFYELLSPKEWNELTAYKRDYGGNFFKQLNINSPYVDSRVFNKSLQAQFISDLINNTSDDYSSWISAYDFSLHKFGESLTENIIRPIVEKFANTDLENTHNFVLKLLLLERLILLDLESILQLDSTFISKRLGFPDQLNYPEKFLPNKKALYPKVGGIQTLIERLESLLIEQGIKILTQSQVTKISLSEQKINSCEFIHNGEVQLIEDIDLLSWNASLFILPKVINHSSFEFENYTYDPPQNTVFVNLITQEVPNCHGLFYTFVFEPGFKTHRVTNYYNFNTNAQVEDLGYSMCLEMIASHSDDIGEFAKIAIDELIKIGMISDPERITFIDTKVIKGGYPSVSIRNIDNLSSISNHVKNKFPNNFKYYGILSKDNLFFQPEILRDVYQSICEENS